MFQAFFISDRNLQLQVNLIYDNWRKKMNSTTAIMNKGMNYLLEKLGVLETEIFISHLLREPFDYTKWRRENLYNDISLQELNQKAALYAKEKCEAIK
jgi:hypothetical protein